MFERQGAHLLFLAGLLVIAGRLGAGSSAPAWFWVSIAVPVGHQVFVWYCWRAELLDRRPRPGFRAYAAGFGFWAVARIVTIVGLALATRGGIKFDLRWLAVLAAPPAAYAMYSGVRYLTLPRLIGIDHFDPAYRELPLVREGLFRYTPNALYKFGMLGMWIPGLWWGSREALVSAAFTHAYIWVHYWCTEVPDMRRIYGESNG